MDRRSLVLRLHPAACFGATGAHHRSGSVLKPQTTFGLQELSSEDGGGSATRRFDLAGRACEMNWLPQVQRHPFWHCVAECGLREPAWQGHPEGRRRCATEARKTPPRLQGTNDLIVLGRSRNDLPP